MKILIVINPKILYYILSNKSKNLKSINPESP
jgi:hypothetical protein